jgi:protein KRI1
VTSFPRSIPSTLRRPDTTRIEARHRRAERKEEKFLTRREEVKRMKALRVKFLRQKLETMGKDEGIDFDVKGDIYISLVVSSLFT